MAAQFTPLEFEHLPLDEQISRSRDFLNTMRRRRTVRDFSSKDVPFELVENAIRVAASAPSGANQQPWTFVVVRDAAIKQRIRAAAETEERESYAHRMSAEWLQALDHLGLDWQKPHLELAPYLIVVFGQSYRLETDEQGVEKKMKHYYVTESVGIAVGFLLCALHEAGLATLTHTPSPMGFLSEILNRPANERAYVVIPVGYPSDKAVVPVITKKSLDEVMVVI